MFSQATGAVILLLLLFSSGASAGPSRLFSMCRKVLNLAASGINSALPTGGEIAIRGPEKFVSFDGGVAVVDEVHGIRILTAIERRDDGSTALLYRLPTDAKSRRPVALIIPADATHTVAKLGTEEGRALIDTRTANFLKKNLSTDGKEPTLAMVPEQIGLSYLFTECRYLEKDNILLEHRKSLSNPQRITVQRYEKLWGEFLKANPKIPPISLRAQLDSWADKSRFLIKTRDTPLARPEASPQLEVMTQFFQFIHEQTGENVIRAGAARLADFVPHVNTGVELRLPLLDMETYGAVPRPVYIPHDVLVNMLNYSWAKAPEILSSTKPAELALGRYHPNERETPGTYSHQVASFKDADKLEPVAESVSANAQKMRAFIAGHFPESESFVVVPMPSSETGRATAGMSEFARAVAALPNGAPAAVSAMAVPEGGNTQKTQKHLWERLHNAARNFTDGAADAEVFGKNIVLVDDVRTTDATLTEARRLLHKAGAKKVIVIALAETGHSPSGAPLSGVGSTGRSPRMPMLTARPTAVFTTRRPAELAHFFNKPIEEREADPAKDHAWKAATALGMLEDSARSYDFLRRLEREEDVMQILQEAKRLSLLPKNVARLTLKYDVNFIVDQFNEFSRQKVDVLLGSSDRALEPSPYERFLIKAVREFIASGQPLGAFPNNLSPKARVFVEIVAPKPSDN